MYYILWKWGLWKVKVRIMMKAGDKMITCGTILRKWKWQCLKVKVIIIESESNCSPMAPAIHYIFGLIRLKAILFSVNLIHFCIFLWFSLDIIGHLVFLRAFTHRCYLHAVEAFGAALEEKTQRLFFYFGESGHFRSDHIDFKYKTP